MSAQFAPTSALSLIFAASAATSVPPLDHVRVSTRRQIFYFTGAPRPLPRWMQCEARSMPNQGNGEGVYYVLD
ncbi:MAG: hypothetical protein IKC94_04960 [Lentisphaeria bacterium]|nr:hypothetical protein [Lentisphaeria bacterium]